MSTSTHVAPIKTGILVSTNTFSNYSAIEWTLVLHTNELIYTAMFTGNYLVFFPQFFKRLFSDSLFVAKQFSTVFVCVDYAKQIKLMWLTMPIVYWKQIKLLHQTTHSCPLTRQLYTNIVPYDYHLCIRIQIGSVNKDQNIPVLCKITKRTYLN